MPKLSTATNLSESAHRSQLFTVRVWLEDLGDGRSEWRGKVQHTLGGEACYFRDWQTLVSFLVEKAAVVQTRYIKETK
jgi:hypothetical protein